MIPYIPSTTINYYVLPTKFITKNIPCFNKEKYVQERALCLYMGIEPKKKFEDFTTDELIEMELDDASLIKQNDYYKANTLPRLLSENAFFQTTIGFKVLRFIIQNYDQFKIRKETAVKLNSLFTGDVFHKYGLLKYKHALRYTSGIKADELQAALNKINVLTILDNLPETYTNNNQIAKFLSCLDYELAVLHELLQKISPKHDLVIDKIPSSKDQQCFDHLLK